MEIHVRLFVFFPSVSPVTDLICNGRISTKDTGMWESQGKKNNYLIKKETFKS